MYQPSIFDTPLGALLVLWAVLAPIFGFLIGSLSMWTRNWLRSRNQREQVTALIDALMSSVGDANATDARRQFSAIRNLILSLSGPAQRAAIQRMITLGTNNNDALVILQGLRQEERLVREVVRSLRAEILQEKETGAANRMLAFALGLRPLRLLDAALSGEELEAVNKVRGQS